MTENEIFDSLSDTFILCDIHMERMMYASTAEDITQGLNALSTQLPMLISIYDHLKAYYKARSLMPR